MIRSEVSGVDASKYVYETNLNFATEFGQKLLQLILSESDNFLTMRKRYVDPRKHLEELKTKPELLADKEKAKRFLKRCLQLRKSSRGQEPIDFKQYYMPASLTKEFYDLVPQWLTEIAPVSKDTSEDIPQWVRDIIPGEPLPVVQISQLGDFLAPHRGHQRQSSLFMLLQGNSEETRWYRETEPFEVFDFLRVPDLDKIEHVVTAELVPFKWYIFNHKEWHSVHRFGNGKRINLGIDFDSISAPDLRDLIKEHTND